MKATLRALLPFAACAVALLPASPGRASDDSGDRAPEVTFQAAPEYPFSLQRSGNRGVVQIGFDVDPQGNVTSPEVIESSHPDFEAPAVEAVLKWKFKPGLKNGRPVFVHMRVPIIFEIRYSPGAPGVDVWKIPSSAPRQFPAKFQYDEPPKPVLTSAPVYPFDLLTQKVTGSASVTFAIDPFGQPHVIRLENASRPEFGAAITAMVEAWKFEPATKDGKPSWSILRKDEDFDRYGRDFPINDSAERLLKDLKRTPCPILMDFRSLDAPLKGRFQPSPVVPESVRTANVRAEALIEFVVDHAGHAQLPRILSATNPDFGWAAATAVGRWQYTIPSVNRKPVDVFVRVPMVFSPPIAPL
jgi:TonB family protein